MRSLMWTGVFCLLVVELGLTLVLVIPFPRNIRNWIVLRVSKLELKKRFRVFLTFLFSVLCFALLDTVNFLSQIYARKETARGAGDPGEVPGFDPTGSIDRHILREREYKAGRNLYLVGFALTLLFVIGRITDLMEEHAELSGKIENLKLAVAVVEAVGDAQSVSPAETASGPKIYGDNDAPTTGIEMKPMGSKKKD